jgi:triphosphoribosyl-dephospho-CoA synthase
MAEPVRLDPAAGRNAGAAHPDAAARIGRHAVRSLHQELVLYPKPGLVSLIDSGSHHDMDAATFVRSLFSLRRYFCDIALAGSHGAGFATLRSLGIDAERRMLAATGGINTHRGAIFTLGLLCAAAGRAEVGSTPAARHPAALRAALRDGWGDALASHRGPPDSHGAAAGARHAAAGAREQAAAGFPAVFDLALPTLQRTLAAGRGMRCARVDALFALMAALSDTNVYHRGGADGARTVRDMARRFLDEGGTAAPDWLARAEATHQVFVARRLSPGGAADLLAATCFVHGIGAGMLAP